MTMKDQRHLLKIKIKSLAAEAKIIHKAERKLKITPRLDLAEIQAQLAVLGDERKAARVIRNLKAKRRAELRAKPWFTESQAKLSELHLHRIHVVREEAYASHLAYGFIRGKTASEVEGNPASLGGIVHNRIVDKAERIAGKYGTSLLPPGGFREWVKQRDVAVQWKKGWPSLFPAYAVVDDPALQQLSGPPDSDDTALLSQGTP
jgi:hypothetical protein